jgi:hypothetical protein
MLQQQTRAQLPVEPRDHGQAGLHTLRFSNPHMSVHRVLLIDPADGSIACGTLGVFMRR